MGAQIPIPVYQANIEQRLSFEGGVCPECGEVHFPPKGACVSCSYVGEFEVLSLSGEGEVYSYTVLSPSGAPPEFSEEARIEGRYSVAIVELEEGPHITGQLVDVNLNEIEIGMPVSGRIRRIYQQEGVVRYGFKFTPSE